MTFLHAIWALLNLFFFVGTFTISYRNYRNFSERFGCLPSGLLILAVAATCSGSRNKVHERPISVSFVKSTEPTDRPYRNDVVVYDDALYKVTQSVITNPVQNTDSLQVQSVVVASGITLGTQWETRQITVNLLPGRRASYQSTGTLTWYLLGVPLYVQLKDFEGEMTLR